jgi:hypothetical protein
MRINAWSSHAGGSFLFCRRRACSVEAFVRNGCNQSRNYYWNLLFRKWSKAGHPSGWLDTRHAMRIFVSYWWRCVIILGNLNTCVRPHTVGLPWGHFTPKLRFLGTADQQWRSIRTIECCSVAERARWNESFWFSFQRQAIENIRLSAIE